MNETELMVLGCLTFGPLRGEQLTGMLRGVSNARISRALKVLCADERAVYLTTSGRWALIHRT